VKWFNGITVRCDSSLLPSILALPFVSDAQPVKRSSRPRIQKSMYTDGGPFLAPALLRNSSFDYGGAFRQIRQLNGDFLHDLQFTGQGMLIAVLDAGFNSADMVPAFDNLRNSNRILTTWDFVAQEASVYEDDAHGTSVLSCMAADVPGQMVGTAPGASFLLLRSEDATAEYLAEEYNWAAAAAFADSSGADLISSSLGYTQFDDPSQDHVYNDLDGNTCPATRAADIAAAKGILVLSSAGNLGNSTWHYISVPADADSILAVGAVDSMGYMAAFSSWGPSADGRVKPDVAAMGRKATVTFFDGSFGVSNGTSFSCPILAGAAACLWQAHPGKNNVDILNAIRQSAGYYSAPGDSLGYGIPDFLSAHTYLGGTVLTGYYGEGILGTYPNPFTDRLQIDYYSASGQTISLTVFDVAGREVLTEQFQATANFINKIDLKLPQLAAGSYQVVLRSSDQVFTRPVLKVRQ
jgi:subtilisin family serine protease